MVGNASRYGVLLDRQARSWMCVQTSNVDGTGCVPADTATVSATSSVWPVTVVQATLLANNATQSATAAVMAGRWTLHQLELQVHAAQVAVLVLAISSVLCVIAVLVISSGSSAPRCATAAATVSSLTLWRLDPLDHAALAPARVKQISSVLSATAAAETSSVTLVTQHVIAAATVVRRT